MANVFEKAGIKEVADVQIIDTVTGQVVLMLDTLKISTIETTAEQTEARGGKGNPPLVIWDFGKEINITLQDALISDASLAVLMGSQILSSATQLANRVLYMHEEVVQTTATVTYPAGKVEADINSWINKTSGKSKYNGDTLTVAKGDHVIFFWTEDAADTDFGATIIEVGPNTFPGTYTLVGDTVKRNQDGVDKPFQFVIPRAKMSSEVTITLEAEGDPSVFDMNMRVLKDPVSGNMMYFASYDVPDTTVTPVP